MAQRDITINVKTLDNTTHQLQLAHDAPVPLIKARGERLILEAESIRRRSTGFFRQPSERRKS